MTDTSKSYRIRTKIGSENDSEYVTVNADLVQDYDTFEVLSVNIKNSDAYRLQNSNYGVVVGRVLANNGFGIPNAKISIFVKADAVNGTDIGYLYPFTSSVSKDRNGVRYNLLPNERIDGCHQVVGTFPSKRYALDNDVILEVFDDYYSFTTKTNNAGDYLICGVPVGAHTIHMDLDLSDCGILSQKPRDFVYKGYTIEQFESPTKFKGGTDYSNLSQVFTQDQVVNVNPFWGNDSLGETIGISRADIDVNFKFEPTCVFMGSIVSDNASNGFNKKCKPTEAMGNMDELVTGEGKIEMIRKTPGGSVEEFQIKGNKLINADGVWCYQIPMNLDYMVTDEYGNMVPTDNPEKGIPTRACVRFRISMEDSEENTDNFFRGKVLVPHNPQILNVTKDEIVHENYDYEFGTYTKDESFRDLFWNNVYSVKSYIPRIQKSAGWKSKPKFSGIKGIQNYGPNNPMPYNNIRIKLPLMFTIMCAIIKAFVFITKIVNMLIAIYGYVCAWAGTRKFLRISKPNNKNWLKIWQWQIAWAPILPRFYKYAKQLKLVVLNDGLCPDLENWYFAPMFGIEGFIGNGTENSQGILSEPINFNDGTNKWGWWYKIIQKSPNAGDAGIDKGSELCGCSDSQYIPTSGSQSGEGEEGDSEGGDNTVYKCKDVCCDNGDTDCFNNRYNIMSQTFNYVMNGGVDDDDPNSIDDQNVETSDESYCLTIKTDYLLPCIEMNLAQEYKVINFDFYNDWLNGVIYNPRWVRYKKKKVRFLWITWAQEKIKGCMDDTRIFSRSRRYVQQCAVGYASEDLNGYNVIKKVKDPIKIELDGNGNYKATGVTQSNNYHKKRGFKYAYVFGKKGGICHEGTTMKGQKVYYLKPCEFDDDGKKINLYATDLILLGTFNDCDLNGVPQTFQHLTSTTYIMPTNLAFTNMDSDASLYATDNGTICSGGKYADNGQPSTSGDVINNGVSVVDQTSSGATPLRNEIEYNNPSPNDRINEMFETRGDTMALTEAAGISWNYTGPAQGEIDEKRMYYPGGHFLGLSCVNSQTNLKTCFNLSRICEIGVNMSQSRDNVRTIGPDGLRYTYSVPTGFISGDEIVDSDFRSMFATLNKKRLKATKRNNSTGYMVYDFEFAAPLNFDGAFQHIVYDNWEFGVPYNTQIVPVEEDLTDYNIDLGSLNDDYDGEQAANTQTRTREVASLDYYAFRFGLTYSQLGNYLYPRSKFLVRGWDSENQSNLYFLPQYENSYYFYFGLKQGATALDEFNKQFYSECDDLKVTKAPNMLLNYDVSETFCHGKAKVYVMTEGLSLPYQSIEVYSHNTGERYVIGTRFEFGEELAVLQQETFCLPYEHNSENLFDFGVYTITIIDDDGISITKDIEVGLDLFSYHIDTMNFTYPIGNEMNSDFNIFNGGFALIDSFSSKYHAEGYEDVEYIFQLMDDDGNFIGSYENIENEDDNTYWRLAYGEKKDTDYYLYLRYRCSSSDDYVNIKIKRVRFSDNSNIELRVGDSIYSRTPILDSDIMGKNDTSWWWESDEYDIGAENSSDDYKKWFYRKMFFKESNHGEFDSRVFAKGGKKVFWGVPQSNNSYINPYGWRKIYCSERPYGIPNGTYLDDTKTLKPTYGVNYCAVQEEEEILRAGVADNNCTYNYCAQAYNGTDVSGKYRIRYDKNGHYGTNGLYFPQGYYSKYFHVGYGCIYKPIPYGSLMFLEFSSLEELEDKLRETTISKFGIIYPTFIYPVIKRPFYGDYKMVIWGNTDVTYDEEMGTNPVLCSEKFYEYGYKLNIGIHNGVTFDRFFNEISLMDAQGFESEQIENFDTYDVTEASNLDRIIRYSHNDDMKISDEFEGAIFARVEEGVPIEHVDELAHFSNTLVVNENYDFSNSILYYQNYDNDMIEYVNVINYDYGNVEYYIGKFNTVSDNIDFLMERPVDNSNRYAYATNGSINRFYVLCRFKENPDISCEQWYSNVFVNISNINNGICRLKYSYKDSIGATINFNEVIHYTSTTYEYPNNINEILDIITNNGIITLNNGETIVFPFVPVKNYAVKDEWKINNVVFDDFGKFMQRLITLRKLVPITHLSRLSPIESGDFVFGIGVKAIESSENNDIYSHVYKVYPNTFRTNVYYESNGNYDLSITPNPFDGGFYSFCRCERDINMVVEVDSQCIVRINLENGGNWCYYDIDGDRYYGEAVVYYTSPKNVILHVEENTDDANRSCTMEISSYYGEVKDSALFVIEQSNMYCEVLFDVSDVLTGCGSRIIEIPFTATDCTNVHVDSNTDWVSIENSDFDVNCGENMIIASVNEYNNSPYIRRSNITIHQSNGNSKTFVLTQNGYDTTPTLNIKTVKRVISLDNFYYPIFSTEIEYTNANGTDYYGKTNILENDGFVKVKYHLIGSIIVNNGSGDETMYIDEWHVETLTHEFNGEIINNIQGTYGIIRCDMFEFINSNLNYKINLINNANNWQ